MAGWTKTQAKQEETNAAFLAFETIYRLSTGELTLADAHTQIFFHCGLAIQGVVDAQGNLVGVRVLPDTTSLTGKDPFDLMFK